jgi:hypothetical protein
MEIDTTKGKPIFCIYYKRTGDMSALAIHESIPTRLLPEVQKVLQSESDRMVGFMISKVKNFIKEEMK